VLLQNAAAPARCQRLDPWQLQAARLTETIVGSLAAGPAERWDEQVERGAKHQGNFGAPIASLPAAVCDDQA